MQTSAASTVSSVSARPVGDQLTRRTTERPASFAPAQFRRIGEAPRAANSSPRTSPLGANRSAVPSDMDAELWQSLSSDELDHFMRPGMPSMLFGAQHTGVPRGMHLDIRA